MICYTPQFNVSLPAGILYSVSQKGKYWRNGETIEIYFMDDNAKGQQMVKNVVRELGFINLKFKFVDDPKKSDIRISFKRGRGSWSYVGTDALYISKSQATMNFGWLEMGTVRHEFGHMLGLLHEHMNPSADIQWNEKVVINELSGPPNNWDKATIKHNVLKKLNPMTVNYSHFDRNSVMLYFFPDEWTLDGNGTRANQKWSKQDKQHLMELYPHDNWFARLQRFFV